MKELIEQLAIAYKKDDMLEVQRVVALINDMMGYEKKLDK